MKINWILCMITLLVSVCLAGNVKASRKEAQLDSSVINSESLLKDKIIFFGHQSVGENIINGMKLINPNFEQGIHDIKENPDIRLNEPGFFHAKVGKNNDPKSKIAEFDRIIRNSFQGRVDIAFVKLCYVDFNKNTDMEDLFIYYKTTMDKLRHDYPDIKFVHLTVPLTRNNENWKTKIKKITGLGDLWEYGNNVLRNKYSKMILNEFSGKEPVFDIAQLESTRSDGTRVSFELHGQTYDALAPELTSDGGHLNDQGSRLIATELLNYMSTL